MSELGIYLNFMSRLLLKDLFENKNMRKPLFSEEKLGTSGGYFRV